MLKKIINFNKKITPYIIAFNIFLILLDISGLVLAETHELKVSFLKYLAIHLGVFVLFIWSLETRTKNKENDE